MLINFNFFKPVISNKKEYKYIPFGQKTQEINFLSLDEFIKNVQTAKMLSVSDKQLEIKNIFDKTYQKILEQNPITKELNITKPELTWNNNKDCVYASYNPATNKIDCSELLYQDVYLITYQDENNQSIPINVLTKNEAQQYISSAKEKKKYNLTKLTPNERKLFISGIFAHELRHFIQAHLINSTQGCMEQYRNNIKNALGALQEANNALLELTKEYNNLINDYNKTTSDKLPNKDSKITSRTEEELKQYEYSLNYQPKKIITDDAKLKFSLNKNDNRYWSTKNHLLTSPNGNLSDDEYLICPQEIDAFHYQKEFLLSLATTPEYKNCREEVILGMLLDASNQYKQGLISMHQFGYPQLVTKIHKNND